MNDQQHNSANPLGASTVRRMSKPRCYLVYALAPEGTRAADANRLFNEYVGDTTLPLALYHDHFIGHPGGIAIFFAETAEEREALASATHLDGWHVELRPLIFSHSPAALDEQIAFTLRAYRNADWEALQRDRRPTYGSPAREAETAEEDTGN